MSNVHHYSRSPSPPHSQRNCGIHSKHLLTPLANPSQYSKLIHSINAFEEKNPKIKSPQKLMPLADGRTKKDTRNTPTLIVRTQLDRDVHIALLQSEFEAGNCIDAEVSKYKTSLKARKEEEEKLRKLRDRDRHQQLLEDQRDQVNRLAEEARSALLSRLCKQSKHERRIARQLQAVRNEKEVMLRNYAFREAQYEAQREILANENICVKQDDYLDEVQNASLVRLQYQNLVQANAQEKHDRHVLFAERIVDDLISLSFKMIEYKNLNDGVVPTTLLNDWIFLFVKSKMVSPVHVVDPELDKIVLDVENATVIADDTGSVSLAAEQTADPAESIHLLDTKEFTTYLEGNDEWQFRNSRTEPNHVLGTIISRILSCSFEGRTAQMTAIGRDMLSLDTLLKICVLGKPMAGKSTLASKLASAHNLSEIYPETLVRRAIQMADHKDKYPNVKCDEELYTLGQRVRQALVSGRDVDDEILVSLIVYRIRQLCGQDPTTPIQTECQKNDNDTGIPVPSVIPDPACQSSFNGYVLVGFPCTKEQAAMLERELTGNEEPKPITPGNIKRSPCISADRTNPPSIVNIPSTVGKRKSNIVPGPLVSDSIPAGSDQIEGCFDVVLTLQITNETAIRRWASLKENEPPPSANTYQNLNKERHYGITEYDCTKTAHLHMKLSKFEEQEPLLIEWFTQFNNLTCIDANDLNLAWVGIDRIINDTYAKKGNSCDHSAATSTKRPISPSSGESKQGRPKSGPRTQSARSRPVSPPKDLKSESPTLKPVVEDITRPTPKLLSVLADEWALIETAYTNTLKYLFRSLRRERETLLVYFHKVQHNFEKYVSRPDTKQQVIQEFQDSFNNIDTEMRGDSETKSELHMRTEEMRDKLWLISDERREQAEAERMSIINSQFLGEKFVFVMQAYVAMMQAELDRYAMTRHLVIAYAQDANNFLIGDTMLNSLMLPRPVLGAGVDEKAFKPVNLSLSTSSRGSSFIRPTSSLGRKPSSVGQDTTIKPASSASKRQGSMLAIPGSAHGSSVNIPKPAPQPLTDEKLPENSLFPGLFKALDSAMQFISQSEEDNQAILNASRLPTPADGKESSFKTSSKTVGSANRAKPSSPGANSTAEANPIISQLEGDKNDGSVSISMDYRRALSFEASNTRILMKRILDIACDHMREMQTKALDLYTHLDECVGRVYIEEMAGIKQLVFIVQQAIELELTLPNQLTLNGAQVLVHNVSHLQNDPNLNANAAPAIERPSPHAFTVSQLKQLLFQFRNVSCHGLIPIQAFRDLLTRISLLPTVNEYIPENLVPTPSNTKLHDFLAKLDSHHCGYVSWHKFVMFALRILPAPPSQIHGLAKSLASLDESMTMTQEMFMNMELWFEGLESHGPSMKSLLFDLFSLDTQILEPGAHRDHVLPNKTVAEPEYLNGNLPAESLTKCEPKRQMDMLGFALSMCYDPNNLHGLRKAFDLFNGQVNRQQLSWILSHTLVNGPLYPVTEIMNLCGNNGLVSFDAYISVCGPHIRPLDATTVPEPSPFAKLPNCRLYELYEYVEIGAEGTTLPKDAMLGC